MGQVTDATLEMFEGLLAEGKHINSTHSEEAQLVFAFRRMRKLEAAARMALEMIETDAHERRHVRWALKDALGERHE